MGIVVPMALFTKHLRKHIFVHPAQQNKLSVAVKSALMKDQRKFSDQLEGALLNASNLKVIGNHHLIVDGFLSMEVEADFQVFCPKVGTKLEGIINKISKGHIGCLVMDLFNASIAKPPNSAVEYQIGEAYEFIVTEVIIDGDILSLRGSFSDDHVSVEYESEKKKKKERIKEEDSSLFLTQSDPSLNSPKKVKLEYQLEEEDGNEITSERSHKSLKKRKKHAEVTGLSGDDNELVAGDNDEVSPKKKGKKSKRKKKKHSHSDSC